MMKQACRVIGIAIVGVVVGVVPHAFAAAPSSEVAVSSFAGGFPSSKGIGPVGLAFSGGGDLFVGAGDDLYRFSMSGGTASSHKVGSVPGAHLLGGLAFGQDGNLYAGRWTKGTTGDLVQLEPNTGLVLQTVASGLRCPAGVAVDPATGDLFVSELSCGKDVVRISGGRATPFVTGIRPDGITFGPDGTLYVAHAPDADGYTISAVSGTTSARPGARTGISKVPSVDGIAASSTTGPTGAPDFLIVNRTDGTISRIELGEGGHQARDLVTGGTRGDFAVVGPDACLYATQTSEVLKVTNADGSCRRDATVGNVAAGLGAGLAPTAVASTRRAAGAVACTAKRLLKLRYKPRGRTRLTTARLYLGKRFARKVSGRALSRGVTVKSLPAARFTLTIRAVTTKHRKVTVRKRYGACAGRKA